MARSKKWPISGDSTKVFWINAIIFVVWCAAEGLVRTDAGSENTTLFTVSSIIFQLLLMGASFLAAFLWSELSETRKTISNEIVNSRKRISQTLSDTSEEVLAEVSKAMREGEEIRDELSRGLFNFEGRRYRTLTYSPETGAVYYGRDEESNRNILFNNLTLKKILSEVQRADSKSNGMPLLRWLGSVAGTQFALRLEQILEQKGTDFDLEVWLREWAKYDSQAGFGCMSLESFAKDPCEARISLRNSFLTYGDHPNQQGSLCGFMEGYIEGLLKHLPEHLYKSCEIDQQSIRVSESECYNQHRTRRQGCIFLAQMQPTASAGVLGRDTHSLPEHEPV